MMPRRSVIIEAIEGRNDVFLIRFLNPEGIEEGHWPAIETTMAALVANWIIGGRRPK